MSRHTPVGTAAALIVLLLLPPALVAGCGGDGPADRPHPAFSAAGGSLGDVLVVVADEDFQDAEFWALRDGLVEAGHRPVVANGSGGESKGMDGTTVPADLAVADANAADYAAMVIVGGPGAEQYWDDAGVQELVRRMCAEGKTVGAICLAPVVLARAGVLQGRKATVWEDNRDDLAAAGCSVQNEAVVVDGLIVTGDGPDAAEEFAQAFIATLSASRHGLTPLPPDKTP